MSIWTVLQPTQASDFAGALIRGKPPGAYLQDSYASVGRELVEDLGRRDLGLDVEWFADSGTARLSTRGAADPEEIRVALAVAIELGAALDPSRTWFTWQDLSDEERPVSGVLAELTSEINGVPSLGPGGRITAFHLGSSNFVDVGVRARDRPVASRWRTPYDVGAAVSTMIAGGPPDQRLRAAFGYTEPSFHERPGLVRPGFVFLLDRPTAEAGPAWRVTITVPATEISDNDLPPGVDGGVGAGGCV